MTAAPRDTTSRLRATCALLNGLHAPTEHTFMVYGQVLQQAATTLRTLGGDMTALSARLSSADIDDTTTQLTEALRQIIALNERHNDMDKVLGGLTARAAQVATDILHLRKTVAEVSVLAMNAKIQASHLSQAGSDFGVFTVEIARLGDLALATIDQTTARVVQLRHMIQGAQKEATEFENRNARELPMVHARLNEGLDSLSAHRSAAAAAAADAGERSSKVASLLAAAIGEMQINDIASQCIAHVSSALDIIADLLSPEPPIWGEDRDWLSQLTEDRRRAMAGVVLRLQAVQLKSTRDDFRNRVGRLAEHMGVLANNARDVSTSARQAFAGNHLSEGSFVDELQADITTTRHLLLQIEESRASVKRMMDTMGQDFATMAEDLTNIQSIDADMRVMGLNATLKCGRLGNQGRALGVIAQELRGCSKRTEERSGRLSVTLAAAMRDARDIADHRDGDQDGLGLAAGEAMDASLRMLNVLGHDLDQGFLQLRTEIDTVTTKLDTTVQGMDVGHTVAATLDRAIREIDDLAAIIDPDASDPSEVRHEVEMLLHGHYTMESERIIHDLFADGNTATAPIGAANAAATQSDDLDDCFF